MVQPVLRAQRMMVEAGSDPVHIREALLPGPRVFDKGEVRTMHGVRLVSFSLAKVPTKKPPQNEAVINVSLLRSAYGVIKVTVLPPASTGVGAAGGAPRPLPLALLLT